YELGGPLLGICRAVAYPERVAIQLVNPQVRLLFVRDIDPLRILGRVQLIVFRLPLNLAVDSSYDLPFLEGESKLALHGLLIPFFLYRHDPPCALNQFVVILGLRTRRSHQEADSKDRQREKFHASSLTGANGPNG